MTKPTFAIGIPTINRWDILKPFLEEYFTAFPLTDIIVLDNGNQAIDADDLFLTVLRPEKRLSVAASWNLMCNLIFKNHNYALILNDDVYLSKTIQQLTEFLTLHNECDFFSSMYGMCSFILPKRTFRIIGNFDEKFEGAYFEDTDYERRMKIAQLNVLRHFILNPKTMHASASIQKDPSLNSNFEANGKYYFEKWGGHKGGEIFTTPFNK